jgi:hypothetical protein
LWWDSGNSLLKVYNGSTFKTISAATASASAPTSNVTGDLWYDTTNAQLKVWTGTAFLLIGPAFTAGTGTTGAIVNTITDNTSVSHVVIQLYVADAIVGIVSKDAAFTPQVALSGYTTVRPGITLSTSIGTQVPLFQGTSTNSSAFGGLSSTQFMRSDANTSTTGTLAVTNNTGLKVGSNSDFAVSVAGTAVTIANQTSNGNLSLNVNLAGLPTNALTVVGSTGQIGVLGLTNLNSNAVGNIGSSSSYFNTIFAKATSALYADVAERFAADAVYSAGTIVELGGAKEITRAQNELSERVFGVISTQAAYLMNSGAGPDATHPPIAMTGRVPVQVIGKISKGDRLVSAGAGLARAARAGEATAFNVIGRALADKLDVDSGTVEAIVTIN